MSLYQCHSLAEICPEPNASESPAFLDTDHAYENKQSKNGRVGTIDCCTDDDIISQINGAVSPDLPS